MEEVYDTEKYIVLQECYRERECLNCDAMLPLREVRDEVRAYGWC